MDQKLILAVICGAIAFVGTATVCYHIFQMTVIDAKARGLKHPKFWGLFTMSGNNSNGLILYLIGRRNYPIQNMSRQDQEKIIKYKKCAGAGIIFLAAGFIGFLICMSI